MEPNEADRKAALGWYANKYPAYNSFANTDGPGSSWDTCRQSAVDGFITGMQDERRRSEKIIRLVQQLADAIRKGSQ